jgi:hypothetical protein
MVMAILLVGGISWKAKPMKRFGTQIAAKIQRFRLRPIKEIHLTAKPRSFSAQTAYGTMLVHAQAMLPSRARVNLHF